MAAVMLNCKSPPLVGSERILGSAYLSCTTAHLPALQEYQIEFKTCHQLFCVTQIAVVFLALVLAEFGTALVHILTTQAVPIGTRQMAGTILQTRGTGYIVTQW
jgi:hypothetical protein